MLMFLFAGGAVSPMMCPPDEQKDDKKRLDGRKTSQAEGKEKEPKQTVDRNGVAGFLPVVSG